MAYYGMTERFSPEHTVPAEASETLYPRRFVKLGTNQGEVDLCDTEGEQSVGAIVSHGFNETIADGDAIEYCYFGDVKMDCGGSFSAGDDVTTDNTGQAIVSGSTNRILAYALTDGADGSVALVRLRCPARTVTT